jgi:basic membrane protein A
MATSFQINLDGMVTTVANTVAQRSFSGGREWQPTVDRMWLLKAGVHGDHNPTLVSASAWASFQKVWQDLSARRIDVGAIVGAS